MLPLTASIGEVAEEDPLEFRSVVSPVTGSVPRVDHPTPDLDSLSRCAGSERRFRRRSSSSCAGLRSSECPSWRALRRRRGEQAVRSLDANNEREDVEGAEKLSRRSRARSSTLAHGTRPRLPRRSRPS